MVTTIEAVFDGKVFRPEEPPAIEPNTKVRLTVETLAESAKKQTSFLRLARSLKVDGPPDWAENLESYLYERDDEHAE